MYIKRKKLCFPPKFPSDDVRVLIRHCDFRFFQIIIRHPIRVNGLIFLISHVLTLQWKPINKNIFFFRRGELFLFHIPINFSNGTLSRIRSLISSNWIHPLLFQWWKLSVLKKTKEENVNQKLHLRRFAQENYPMEEKLSYKNIHSIWKNPRPYRADIESLVANPKYTKSWMTSLGLVVFNVWALP